MGKSLVFISHISEEKEIAIAFKELIETSFLGMIDVFVSSDEHSISMGQRWLDEITKGLKSCAIEVVLCSPESIKRPWINFEAGSGWIRDIPVIPLCHSGMEPSKLPVPLNLLQAAKATEVSGLKLIFPVLAKAIGANTPTADFATFIAKVKSFELQYTFWNKCNNSFAKINEIDARIIPLLQNSHAGIRLNFTETQIGELEKAISFLSQNDVLRFQRNGSSSLTPRGMFYECSIIPLSKFSSTISDPSFKI